MAVKKDLFIWILVSYQIKVVCLIDQTLIINIYRLILGITIHYLFIYFRWIEKSYILTESIKFFPIILWPFAISLSFVIINNHLSMNRGLLKNLIYTLIIRQMKVYSYCHSFIYSVLVFLRASFRKYK